MSRRAVRRLRCVDAPLARSDTKRIAAISECDPAKIPRSRVLGRSFRVAAGHPNTRSEQRLREEPLVTRSCSFGLGNRCSIP